MPNKRCLIIGSSGQLGKALRETFKEGSQLFEAVRKPSQPGQIGIDLADPAQIRTALRETRPDWIVIAGAFCNVDLCETQPETCRAVNVRGPAEVCAIAAQSGADVVYYSSDQVFDGQGTFSETDPVQPMNVYASSKVDGERTIQKTVPGHHLILRTTCLYGPDDARKNFVIRLADRLRRGETVPVPDDQSAAPTFTEDLAALTRFLLERGHRGLFHATGPEFMSRVAWAQEICRAFDLNPELLVPTPTARLGQIAKRPAGVRLDCRKVEQLGGPRFRNLHDGLEALLRWDHAKSSCFDPRPHP